VLILWDLFFFLFFFFLFLFFFYWVLFFFVCFVPRSARTLALISYSFYVLSFSLSSQGS